MLQWLWMIPALPFAGFLLLALAGARLPRRVIAFIGTCSVGLSAVVAGLVAVGFLSAHPAGNSYTQPLWIWLDITGFRSTVAFYLDALSLVMILVITFVSFLIHLYSTGFMIEEEGYRRFSHR